MRKLSSQAKTIPLVVEAEDEAPAVIAVVAYSIPQFCRANNISPAFYYKLKAQGLAPKETRKLGRVFISIESALEWRTPKDEQAAS